MWTSLCELGDLKAGRGLYVEIDGMQLAVFLDEGRVAVLENRCPHAGASLAGGHVDDGHAVCPWHGWSFRLSDGTLRSAGGVAVRVYPARVLRRGDGVDLVQADLPSPQDPFAPVSP